MQKKFMYYKDLFLIILASIMDSTSSLLRKIEASKEASSILMEEQKKVSSGLRLKPKKSTGNQSTVKMNTIDTSSRSRQPIESEKRTKADFESISSTLLDRFCESILPWRLGTQEDTELNSKLQVDSYLQPTYWTKDTQSSLNSISNENEYLPDIFSSAAEYISRWEPLFLEETRASIVSNLPSTRQLPCSSVKLINTDPNGASILTRSDCIIVPTPIDQSKVVPSSTSSRNVNKQDVNSNVNGNGNTKGANSSNGREAPSSMDLLLISSEPISTPINFEKLGRSVWMLALVVPSTRDRDSLKVQVKVSREYFGQLEQLRKQNMTISASGSSSASGSGSTPVSISASATSSSHSSVNVNSSTLLAYCVNLSSFSTAWREFFALHELPTQIPLCQELLAGDPGCLSLPPTPPHNYDEDNENKVDLKPVPPRSQPLAHESNFPGMNDAFIKILQSRCNASQLHAVSTALKCTRGFTLIMGPPGTGKSSTIISLLNSIHIREYNRYFASLLAAVMGSQGMRCRVEGCMDPSPWIALVSSLAKTKPHMLVAAPSNVAVDNLVERILKDKFIDGSGSKYKPNILRFGGGRSSTVQSVSLEEVVDQEQMAALTDHGRREAVASINEQIKALVKDIFAVQSFLINLRTAFQAHPLPKGFELRVNLETGFPYWVDHITKSVTTVPPSHVKPTAASHGSSSSSVLSKLASSIDKATTLGYDAVKPSALAGSGPDLLAARGPSSHTLETLPEYRAYAHRMTMLLDQLHRSSLKRTRCMARLRPSQHGGLYGVRQSIEQSVVDSSEILFTTLNSSGHSCLDATEFVVAVIDEAAQCVEPSILIPLRKGCRQCILVGDPYQLPSTIFSDKVSQLGYARSLFERLLETGQPKVMLNTQYRMHPTISAFPSATFYAGELMDGSNVKAADYGPIFLLPPIPAENESDFISEFSEYKMRRQNILQPFLFFDLESSQDEVAANSLSKMNVEEARLSVSVLRLLLAEASRYGISAAQLGSIGFITPYSEQVSEIRRALIAEGYSFAHNYGKRDRDTAIGAGSSNVIVIDEDPRCVDIELNTVDGFQGKEKDFIIISCVRANDTNTVGFLSDFRRMNVAITRARYGLFVIGHCATLRTNELWRDLIRHADLANACVSLKTSADDLRASMTHHRDGSMLSGTGTKYSVQKQQTQSAASKHTLNEASINQPIKKSRTEKEINSNEVYSLDHGVIESYSEHEISHTDMSIVEAKEPSFSPISPSPRSSPPIPHQVHPLSQHFNMSSESVELEDGELEE